MVDVSIIIVSWNAERYLRDCLVSIGKSMTAAHPCEVIVIDNGSTDGSATLVENEFPGVKLIKNTENLGFARANNVGIRESSGRYLCLVNSDVVVLGNCISSLVEFMEANPAAGMAGPRILNPDLTLQHSCTHFPNVRNNLCQVLGLNKLFPNSAFLSEPFMKHWAHDTVRKVDVICGMFWMIRREALEEVGLLDEQFFIYGEDVDWCRRFSNAGWDVTFFPRAEAIHYGGASSANAPIRFYLEMHKADLQYWRKHHGRSGKVIYALIVLLRHTARLVSYTLGYLFFPAKRKHLSFKLKRCTACVLWTAKQLI